MNKLIPNWLIWAIVAVAFLGFIDASYLTLVHYKGAELGCDAWGSCNVVTTSEYSVIFGIPMALMGALYYLSVLILALVYVDTKWKLPLKLIPIATSFGFLFSLWLIYLQLFIIHAICLYCMFSAGTSTTLFILSLIYLFLFFGKKNTK
ncbi:MAG: vitamin K epoxide reductase family protein [Nitrospirota bacterium]